MILIECEQGTPEWLAERVGCITMSEASRARGRMDKALKAKPGYKAKKVGDPTDDCLKYAHEVALGRVAGRPFAERYTTFAMERGKRLEDEARALYETRTGNAVLEAGICKTDDLVFGYSTDGFVGQVGSIEIKCPINPLQLYAVWHDHDLSEYMDQIQGGLWITGREWCDFIMYAPQLIDVGKELFYKRVYRDDDYIDGIDGQPGLVDDLLWFANLVDGYENFWRANPAAAIDAANESAAQVAA